MSKIEELRQAIRDIDQQLVELTARRLALAKEVGEIKQRAGQPIRNYVVEAEAIRLVREAATRLGVRPTIAEELLKLEIQESLRVQERDRIVRARPEGPAGKALVAGGAGNMGRWFVDFLESKGYSVSTSDPRGALPGRPTVDDIFSSASGFDIILLATPPSATPSVLRSLLGVKGPLILDIASLKAPHAAELRALAAAGGRVASLHPMWGPNTEILASRNLVVCDCGDPEANAQARALFEDTAANIVEMSLDEHDRAMGLVLGLPHALNLVFGHALARSDVPQRDVRQLGGPTFQRQVEVAREVARENKDLYHEIQRLNPRTPDVLQGLRRSLEEFEAAVADRDRFRAYMGEAEHWFEDKP